MLRRTLFRAFERGGSGPGKKIERADYVPLTEALSLFGYKIDDNLDKKEIKKRFKKLALKSHPDHGGNEAEFQRLIEAQKTLLAARHDKGGKEGRFSFRKYTPENHRKDQDVRASTPKGNGNAGEEGEAIDTSLSYGTVAFFVAFMTAMLYLYFRRATDNAMRLTLSRGQLREEDLKPMTNKADYGKNWHPWGASQHEHAVVHQIHELRDGKRTTPEGGRGISAFAHSAE